MKHRNTAMRFNATPAFLLCLQCILAVFLYAPFAMAGQPMDLPIIPLADLQRELTAKYKNVPSRQWGENIPGIIRSIPLPDDAGGPRVMVLTLDACGGRRNSSVDMGILALLRDLRIPATIFVTTPWLRANETLAKDLAADPLFELAAHGTHHKPASVSGRSAYGIKGTASIAELVEEAELNARAVEAVTGKRPRWFRSGTAYYDEVAVAVIHDLGLGIAGYTVSLDQGATLPAREVARRAASAKSGSILLCHLNHPESGTGTGLAKALPVLKEEGVVFLRLTDAIEQFANEMSKLPLAAAQQTPACGLVLPVRSQTEYGAFQKQNALKDTR